MKRKLSKYSVVIITFLLALLIHAYAHSFLHESASIHPYGKVAVSLVIAVLLFYAAFVFTKKYLKYLSTKDNESSKKFKKANLAALAAGFLIVLFFLFMSFAQIWYSRNLIDDLRMWIAGV